MIDLQAVREALQRRAAGGGGAPVATQVSNPNGPTPLANPPTIPGAPPVSSLPNTGKSAPAGGANPAQQMAKAASVAQGPAFDPETREISKALIQKLLKVM
jgi:hypothetical protein